MNTIINSFITWKKVNESDVQFDVDSIGVYVPQGSTISPGFDAPVKSNKPTTKKVETSTAKIEKKEESPKKEEDKDKTKLTNDDLVEIANRLGTKAKVVDSNKVVYTNNRSYDYFFYLTGRTEFNDPYEDKCKGTISKRNGYWIVTYDKGGTVDLGTYVTRTKPTTKGTYTGRDLSQKRK
jgi:hypothetical protein